MVDFVRICTPESLSSHSSNSSSVPIDEQMAEFDRNILHSEEIAKLINVKTSTLQRMAPLLPSAKVRYPRKQSTERHR